MKLKWLAITLLGSLSAQTHATVIYSDSNTHQINNSIFEDVRLENDSDLQLPKEVPFSPQQPKLQSTAVPGPHRQSR